MERSRMRGRAQDAVPAFCAQVLGIFACRTAIAPCQRGELLPTQAALWGARPKGPRICCLQA
eukprot:13489180-Alexandrium_andersonii.AAC.1